MLTTIYPVFNLSQRTTRRTPVSQHTQRQQWRLNQEKSAIMREGDFLASRKDQTPGPLEIIRHFLLFDNAWVVFENEYKRILSSPGAARAFTLLLQDSERTRQNMDLINNDGIIDEQIKMVHRLAQSAAEMLKKYQDNRDDAKRGERPADVYRLFGMPLRYAAEELGIFEAREAWSMLAVEVTLPFDELENPAWIDPYTGEELEWEEPARVSNVGNLEVSTEMLDEMLDEEDRKSFEAMLGKLGWTAQRYVIESLKAQNGSFTALDDSEPVYFEEDFGNEIEKDFEFKQDLATTDELYDLKALLHDEIWACRKLFKKIRPRMLKAGIKPHPALLAEVQKKFRRSDEAQRFLRVIRAQAVHYAPQDLMTVILEFQHEMGFSMGDLRSIRLPRYNSLAEWFDRFGEEYLEQFNDAKGQMARGDAPEETLDLFTRLTIEEQVRVYLSRKANRVFRETLETTTGKYHERVAKAWQAFWKAWEADPNKRNGPNKQWKIGAKTITPKDDARFHPEFVEAEVWTAILGDTSASGAMEAGWSAWRVAVCPEGAKEYRRAIENGSTRAQANAAFKKAQAAQKNHIVGINRDGLVLASGRKIDWNIARLKIQKGELPLTQEDRTRLQAILIEKGYGKQLVSVL